MVQNAESAAGNGESQASLVVQERAELVVVTPIRRMVFAMMSNFARPTGFAPIVESPTVIERSSPGTMRRILELADQFPTVLDPDNLVSQRAIPLKEMRERYPTVIAHFDDTRVQELLTGHPEMQERVEARMARLQAAQSGQPTLRSIEVLINILRTDGSISGLTDADYIRVASSHEVYGDLMEAMRMQGAITNQREEADFTEVGQKLLKLRRLYEFNPDNANSDPTGGRTKQEAFYAGQVQARLMKRMGAAILAEGDQKATAGVRYYGGLSHRDLGERLLLEHPGRWKKISEEFPELADGPRGQSRWARTPGEYPFDRAEITDVTQNP